MTKLSSQDVKRIVLEVAFRHQIREPTIELAYERFSALTNAAISEAEFREAIASCLHERLIREPVRLPEAALQCHWHLELTPAGVAAARAVMKDQD